MRELFVEKVIDESINFLDNNQRIKLKEILTISRVDNKLNYLLIFYKYDRQMSYLYVIILVGGNDASK